MRFHHPTAGRAFTLVELLVVMAIIGILVAILMPAIAGAKKLAKVAQCGANMRAQGVMLGMYASDCNSFVPSSNNAHRNQLSTSYLALMTIGSPSPACVLGAAAKSYPTGYGWFYWMGYLPPINARGKLGALQCPDAGTLASAWAGIVPFGWAEYMEKWVPTASTLSAAFARQNTSVTSVTGLGANWDCVATGATDYYFRGWYRAGTVKQLKKTTDWRPDDAAAVDLEHNETGAVPNAGYLDSHGDGVNVLYQDGHVRFSGKDIAGNKPHVYYSLLNGATQAQALNFGANACSGYSYTGGAFSDAATAALWAYYQQY